MDYQRTVKDHVANALPDELAMNHLDLGDTKNTDLRMIGNYARGCFEELVKDVLLTKPPSSVRHLLRKESSCYACHRVASNGRCVDGRQLVRSSYCFY